MKPGSDNEFVAFVGIDWADRKHDYCVQPAGTIEREFGVLVHRPEAIADWAVALQRRFRGRIGTNGGGKRGHQYSELSAAVISVRPLLRYGERRHWPIMWSARLCRVASWIRAPALGRLWGARDFSST